MTEKQMRDALDTAIHLAEGYQDSEYETFTGYLQDRGLRKLSKQEFCKRMERDIAG